MGPTFDHFYIKGGELSSDSWFSKVLLMNVVMESAHCDCERNVSGLTMGGTNLEYGLMQPNVWKSDTLSLSHLLGEKYA